MQFFLINADEKTEMWSKILIIHEKSRNIKSKIDKNASEIWHINWNREKLLKLFLNLLCAKFFWGNKTYLHFVSFLYTDMAQEVEILPQVRQALTYST